MEEQKMLDGMINKLKGNGKSAEPLEYDNDIFKNQGKTIFDEQWFDQGERINELNNKGELKDIKFLVEDFNSTQKDLSELAKDNLTDNSVFEAYKQVVVKEVDNLEQLKLHTLKYVSVLGSLEEKVFTE